MIRKVYNDLLDLCKAELHPRGFLLQELSSSTYCGIPNLDSRGVVWTKERMISPEELSRACYVIQSASPTTASDDVKLQLEGRLIPAKLAYDWKNLEVRIFEIDKDKWALVASDALYANRALITKSSRRKPYPVGEKPPFPTHDCRIVLLRDGLLDDQPLTINYRGALDLHSYRSQLSSHQGGSRKRDYASIKIVRDTIKEYAGSFKVILDGFTRREQYSMGLDPLRVVENKENFEK